MSDQVLREVSVNFQAQCSSWMLKWSYPCNNSRLFTVKLENIVEKIVQYPSLVHSLPWLLNKTHLSGIL